MRYASIKYDDIANAPGLSVSVYTQGCPHRCKGCFNPETWDYNKGYNFTNKELDNIKAGLKRYNIKHNLCILGGEPLCPENLKLTSYLITEIKKEINVPIYIWTGYLIEDLIKQNNSIINYILSSIDYLIDGPFIEAEKDLSLSMRGSKNQRIINIKEYFNKEEKML